MVLRNLRDRSVGGTDVGAGFQFEFFCHCCERSWSSGFTPYRFGQLNGMLTRLVHLLPMMREVSWASDGIASIGYRRAREKALAEAQHQAETRFAECPVCHKEQCSDCFDTTLPCCSVCRDKGGAAPAGKPGSVACSQCGATGGTGRFCADCGFDTGGGQKRCPACALPLAPGARFCTDCGHDC